jgi:hypothetical protein
MAFASLVVSIIAFVVSATFAFRAERRYRGIDEPDLALDVGAIQADALIPVIVRLLKGSLEARDVHVLVRIGDNLLHSRCPDLGPHHAEERVQIQSTTLNHIAHLDLPERPFLQDSRATNVQGDAAAVVSWVTGNCRRYAGHLVAQSNNTGRAWRAVGPTIRSRRCRHRLLSAGGSLRAALRHRAPGS